LVKELLGRGVVTKENSPGVDTVDFTYEGYLTRG
jgi:hypothetical protein